MSEKNKREKEEATQTDWVSYLNRSFFLKKKTDITESV